MKKITPVLASLSIFIVILSMQVNMSSCSKKDDTPPGSDTLVIQPKANPYEIHYLGGSGLDQTDPNAPEIDGAAWTTSGNPITVRAAFRFDISSLPANAKISSAKLTLFSNPTPINGNGVDANFGSNNTLLIQRVTASWNKTSNGTWATQPLGDSTTQITIPHTNLSKLDLTNVDVTAIVQTMYASANYGFKIRLQNETYYNCRVFCSSKYSDSTKHPKLVIIYTK